MPALIYPQRLPISVLKKRDLNNLCTSNVIPQKYHQEFYELKSKGTVVDALADTDEEDETED